MKKAILVVSFGTTYKETREKTIGACEQAIQKRFPEYPVYRAFTSNVVRKKIKEQEGIEIPQVKEALQHLLEQGVEEVYIQPLHIILGGEYEKILEQAAPFQSSFKRLAVAKPLLHTEEDYRYVKEVLHQIYGQFGQETATVLMGHGSQHYAFTAYAALDHMLRETPVYLGCVESYPSVELIEKELQKTGVKEVHLAPFMLVAGDHARQDMMSDEEDSWHTFFKEGGYDIKIHLVGLGEYPEIQERYLQHLEQLMK